MRKSTTQRDQAWLEELFMRTWNEHFSDVRRINHIRIEFGRRAKRRLGSISVDRKDPSVSVIRVNGWFREEVVPEFLVQSVIVHELCHYAHGFNSGAKESYHRYPHAGGVIRREFAERNLVELYDAQQRWLKANWADFILRYHQQSSNHRRNGVRSRRKPGIRAVGFYQRWFR